MNRNICAIIPVAGLATRMQPLCRAIPKELLPLGERPIIHHVVEELARAGVSVFNLITSSRTAAIEDYFCFDPVLDPALVERGIEAGWTHGERSLVDCRFHFVRQGAPRGVADAVHHAQGLVENRYFFLHMGDSVLTGDPDHLSRMLTALESHKAAAVLSVQEMDEKEIRKHGAMLPGATIDNGIFKVSSVNEPPIVAPLGSRYGLTGRYLFAVPMLKELRLESDENTALGNLAGLFPPLHSLDGPVIAVKTSSAARLHDAGTIDGYRKAQLYFIGKDSPN